MIQPVVVAFCESGKGFGGAAISLQTYLKGRSSWVKPVIITSRTDGDYVSFAVLGAWEQVVQRHGLSTTAKRLLGTRLGSIADNLFNILPTALNFAYIFIKYKVDLVYLNNDLHCNLAAALGAFLVRKPAMMHLRGFSSITSSSLWVAKNLAHLGYISEAIRQNALKFGVPEQRMSWIPEGIDVDCFATGKADSFKQSLDLNAAAPVVTLIGGLCGWKGQDVLIEAAPLILKQFPQTIFLLVGGSYGHFSAVETQLKAQINRLNLQANVLMLGDRADVADILAASDVVIHASTIPEPLGRTVVEGMAAGKAVIAAKEGGPLDLITDGVDGLLIEPRNAGLLAGTVCHLLAEPTLRQQYGAAAAITAQQYTVINHVNHVESAIRQAVGSR